MLVDTSVWVSHLRDGSDCLADLLDAGEVVCHPFVIGELACGSLTQRRTILSLLQALPMASPVEHEECLAFLDSQRLWGRGLGYVDVHLLASARISGVSLWTLDRRLADAAAQLGCCFPA